jgi:hypothetical protein
MKKPAAIFGIAVLTLIICSFSSPGKVMEKSPVYTVRKLKRPMKINADWNKPEWKKAKEIHVTNYMGDVPSFKPVTTAKMMYDDSNVYVIFRVKDNFIRLKTEKFGGKVFQDACAEFFFSPDSSQPLQYFNLEMNAGGIALMGFHSNGKVGKNIYLTADEFKGVEIAHSLPEKLDKEITEPTTWTIEYRLPLSVLRKFSNVTQPAKGVIWKANFYKTSDMSSNPHYITWALVDNKEPDFHLPQFFGTLRFK